MKRIINYLLFCFLIINLLIIYGCKDFSTLGNADNPVVIKLVPSKNNHGVKKLSKLIKSYVSDKTGLNISSEISPDTISIIEGFEKAKVHVAFINTFGYILANYWGDASARLCLIFKSGEAGYMGQIITNINSRINKPGELNNKIFAFKDPYSTSGFILPLSFLKKNNIKPAKTVFAKSYYKIVLGVYKGEFDAGAIYYDLPDKKGNINDARKEIIAQYPDVLKRVKLLALTGKIKSSPVAFHRNIPAKIRTKLLNALKEFAGDPEGINALKEAYDAIGLAPAKDSDYNRTRELLNTLGKDAEYLIPGGYKIVLRKKIFVIVDHLYP